MSRHSSNEKRKGKTIFESSGNRLSERQIEVDPNLIMRKRSERQASHGVKVLVNREKGMNNDNNVSMENEPSFAQEVKRVPTYSVNTNTNPNYSNMTSNIIQHPPMRTSQHYSKAKDDKLLNKVNFEKMFYDKITNAGLSVRNMNEIITFMNNGLDAYLKNILEKLTSITRIRNVNLNLYSKQSEINPVFKIHTYNLDRQSSVVASGQNIPQNSMIEFVTSPYKDFSVLFTKNTKLQMAMLEQYEELNLKKLRQERVSLYKSKLEEISNLKEKEKEEKTKDEKTTSVSTGKPKQRVRKRDSMLKNVRNTLAKSQKRDEMARHKKETQNTLETFLDNKPKPIFASSLSAQRMDPEMTSNLAESHNNLETYTKFSEISKSEIQGTIGAEGQSNEINLTVFKHVTPSQNIKLPPSYSIRRRITLKDLIQYLEGERKTPLQNLILHRAIVKLNQFSH